MKKLLSCREVWCYDDCDYIVTGETEEDVMTSAVENSIIKHGKREKDMARLRQKLRIHLYYTINLIMYIELQLLVTIDSRRRITRAHCMMTIF